MVARRGSIICAIFLAFTLCTGGAIAQGAPTPAGTPSAQPASSAPKPAAKPPVQANLPAIVKKANEAVGLDVDAKIKNWRRNLDRIEEALRNPKIEYKDLNDYRAELIALRAEAEGLWKKIEPHLKSANDDVQALPPAPAEGQPPELEEAARSRADANGYLSYLTSARTSLDGANSRIDKLIGTILDIRRTRIANNLFSRMPGVFSAATWESAPGQAAEAAGKVRNIVRDWWRAQEDDQILPFIGVALALWLGLSAVGWLGIHRLRRCEGEPPFWRRASTAAAVIIFRSLPTVLPLLFLYNAIDRLQPIPDQAGWIFYSAARAIIIVAVVNALIGTVLSPGDHRWRLIPAANVAALRISGLILAAVLVYAAETLALTAAYVAKAPEALKLALSLPPAIIVPLLLIAILKTPLQPRRDEEFASTAWLRAIRLPVWVIALAVLATGISGYLALSRFIAQQLIVTGAILAIVYLLLLWADGVARAMGDESSSLGSWLAKAARLDEGGRQRLAVPVSLLLKFAVLLGAIPLILNQWQFAWADIFEWYHQLFFGFRIGNTQVSLAALLASAVVFILGYFAAKFFQQWLDNRVLGPAGLSAGLRDSIRTGVGYIGVFAAALFALSYAGFNLSNFAIVAGAFSVGIGFGLQSVVNNFVSGLILLAERPIKVGDLVVVGGEEGYVRKISVRSTEIETFDRANVLVPNSFFVSEKVKNWTLRNKTGRVTVAVGVSYGCDPRKVKAILLQAAQSHPNVMSNPAPIVDFEDFGADALNFKLYAFIYDLDKSVSTRTDLRIAILDAFNAAGIDIPSRQTEITLRDIEWLRDAVQNYLASTAGGYPAKIRTSPRAVPAEPAE